MRSVRVARPTLTHIRRLVAATASAAIASTAACAPEGATAGALTTERDSAGVTIVSNDVSRLHSTCTLAATPSLRIGAEEGAPEYELHRVFGASRLSDGRIVLVNQGTQQLRFYDSIGTFLKSSGRPGKGPGEFTDAFYLWVLPGDTIWVGDYDPWQFLIFSPEGEWQRTVRPMPLHVNSPSGMGVLDGGRIMLGKQSQSATDGRNFGPRTLTVTFHAADGSLIDTLGVHPDGRYGQVGDDPDGVWVFPFFEAFFRVEAMGERIVEGHGSEAELRVFAMDASRRLERIVRWDPGDREIPASALDAERARLSEPFASRPAEMKTRFLEPMISKDRPVADRFPAFSSFMLGTDGRIWLREYHRPDAPSIVRWLAFDADGALQCRLETPRLSNFLEFGSDYVLALDRDSLGVERVVRFALGGPADQRP